MSVKPDHQAVEAARAEVFSSLVSKYARFLQSNALRLSKPGHEQDIARADLAAWVTTSQARAFQGTSYGQGLSLAQIKTKVAREVMRVLRRIRVG